MKCLRNLMLRSALLATTLTLCLPAWASAQEKDPNSTETVNSIRSLILPPPGQNTAGAEFSISQAQAALESPAEDTTQNPLAQSVLPKPFPQPLPNTEGIPKPEPGLPDPAELYPDAYDSAELIHKILTERKSYPVGPRLSFIEKGIEKVVTISGQRSWERLSRYTLNRTLDISRHAFPYAGRNTALVAQTLSNFYVESLELAASFLNNRVRLISSYEPGPAMNAEQTAHLLSTAHYGRTYAVMIFDYTTGLISDRSKAILLMKLLGYLAWDLNLDLKRREPGIAQTLLDIAFVQNGEPHQRLLRDIESGADIRSADVSALRRATYGILAQLPRRVPR